MNVPDSKETKLKQLLYQSCYRGCRETDFLLGNFAKAHLKNFSDLQLIQYEKLLQEEDIDIYNWLLGKVEVPEEFNTEVFQMILKFHQE